MATIGGGGVGRLEISTTGDSSWDWGWFTYHPDEDTIREWSDLDKVRVH